MRRTATITELPGPSPRSWRCWASRTFHFELFLNHVVALEDHCLLQPQAVLQEWFQRSQVIRKEKKDWCVTRLSYMTGTRESLLCPGLMDGVSYQQVEGSWLCHLQVGDSCNLTSLLPRMRSLHIGCDVAAAKAHRRERTTAEVML